MINPEDRLTVREVRDTLRELRASDLERRLLEDLLLRHITVQPRAVCAEMSMEID